LFLLIIVLIVLIKIKCLFNSGNNLTKYPSCI